MAIIEFVDRNKEAKGLEKDKKKEDKTSENKKKEDN